MKESQDRGRSEVDSREVFYIYTSPTPIRLCTRSKESSSSVFGTCGYDRYSSKEKGFDICLNSSGLGDC